jgi:hypothetical protein
MATLLWARKAVAEVQYAIVSPLPSELESRISEDESNWGY